MTVTSELAQTVIQSYTAKAEEMLGKHGGGENGGGEGRGVDPERSSPRYTPPKDLKVMMREGGFY